MSKRAKFKDPDTWNNAERSSFSLGLLTSIVMLTEMQKDVKQAEELFPAAGDTPALMPMKILTEAAAEYMHRGNVDGPEVTKEDIQEEMEQLPKLLAKMREEMYKTVSTLAGKALKKIPEEQLEGLKKELAERLDEIRPEESKLN